MTLRESNKAREVRFLQFSSPCKLPGMGGAPSALTTDPTSQGFIGAAKVNSIFEYQGRFCINGEFWIPETCGILLGWMY